MAAHPWEPPPMPAGELIPDARIERVILQLRGQKVILDKDLATLYEVITGALNQAVKRNLQRFPRDFMFQLTKKELERCLKSQTVISNAGRGGRRSRPYAFTEQGVAMLSSVLHSERAINMNIAIMRAFVRLREILSAHRDLAKKLDELEQNYDSQFRVVFDALRQLMDTPDPPAKKKRIGFV